MVATDVAARGLDIPEVDLVVQCEPPKVSFYFVSTVLLYTGSRKQLIMLPFFLNSDSTGKNEASLTFSPGKAE